MKKFSRNIKADSDAFYMSINEQAAVHIASNLRNFKTAVELCCAVGILSIALAESIEEVTAVDIDPDRIRDARYNAKLYNRQNIQFIEGDVLNEILLESIEAEVAILDPDWSWAGGDKHDHTLDLDKMQPSLRKMIVLTQKHITYNIVTRVPKMFTHQTLAEFGPHRLESIYINGKLKFKVAYFLEGIKEDEQAKVQLII